jgi:RNA polymerase-binding transcription factor DksA
MRAVKPAASVAASEEGGVEADLLRREDPFVRSAHETLDELEALLRSVEHALRRLDDGTYGRCEACAEPIPDAILAVRPIHRRCPAHEQASASDPTPAPLPPSGARAASGDHPSGGTGAAPALGA